MPGPRLREPSFCADALRRQVRRVDGMDHVRPPERVECPVGGGAGALDRIAFAPAVPRDRPSDLGPAILPAATDPAGRSSARSPSRSPRTSRSPSSATRRSSSSGPASTRRGHHAADEPRRGLVEHHLDGLRVRGLGRSRGAHDGLEPRGARSNPAPPARAARRGDRSTRVTLLGGELAFPILLAPVAYHRVLHPDGELETARGAAAAGITWIVSMATNTAIGDIARAGDVAPLVPAVLPIRPGLHARRRAAGRAGRMRGAVRHGGFADPRPAQPPGAGAVSACPRT